MTQLPLSLLILFLCHNSFIGIHYETCRTINSHDHIAFWKEWILLEYKSKWKKKYACFNNKERGQYYIIFFPSENPSVLYILIDRIDHALIIKWKTSFLGIYHFIIQLLTSSWAIFAFLNLKRENVPCIEMNEIKGQSWWIWNHRQSEPLRSPSLTSFSLCEVVFSHALWPGFSRQGPLFFPQVIFVFEAYTLDQSLGNVGVTSTFSFWK